MLVVMLLISLFAQQPATEPSAPAPQPAPSMLPGSTAPTLQNRVGDIDTLIIHYAQRENDQTLRWDVIIKDRDLLSHIEKMRLSDWHGTVLFANEQATTTRIGDEKYSGSLGVMKFAGRPFGFRIKIHNQPWALYVETGSAANELAKLIDAEAQKQRPQK